MSKMGCINSKNQKEAITRSKQIDRILRADGEKLTSEVKLLLLGMSHTKDYLISRFKLIINNITRDQVASERAFWMCVCKWFKKWHHRICLCVCIYSWVNGRVTKIKKKNNYGYMLKVQEESDQYFLLDVDQSRNNSFKISL